MSIFGKSKKLLPTEYISLSNNSYPFNIESINAQKHPERGNEHYLISIDIRNQSKKEIESIMVGFEFITKFQEYFDHKYGYSSKIIESDRNEGFKWSFHIPEGAIVGYIITYPFKIRYLDGTIWKADLDEVSKKIKNLYNFTVNIQENLKQ